MTSIPITFHSDKKGYFDRQCPNNDCLYTFKILMKDWEEKVSDDEVHCPMCGHIDTSDKWFTKDQAEKMREIVASWAMDYAQKEFDKAFKDIEQSTRNNKHVKVTYKSGHRVTFINNPIGQSKEWETDICCEICGTHYSVIGAAFFCPCCGHNSAVSSFNDSLDSIKKMLDSLRDMRRLIAEKYDMDSAETMYRSMLEGSIGDMVSAFQKLASCKYEELSGRKARANDFQIIDKGSKLFEDETGIGYNNWLSAPEMDVMKVMFQRRHLIEHNNGMIDQEYLNKSHDTSYSIGQRIIVKEADAYNLLDIIKKLGNGIITIPTGGCSNGNS